MSDVEARATGTPALDPAGTTQPQASTPETSAHGRPLTSAEKARLRSIARSIESATDHFDKTYRACPPATWAACLDRAWEVLYWSTDWPPYYLRHFDTRTRGCPELVVAVDGVNSFVLGGRQVIFGDPAEYGTSIQRSSYLALVDGLRPVPSELREAAASGCR